jgi:hypothetical protein
MTLRFELSFFCQRVEKLENILIMPSAPSVKGCYVFVEIQYVESQNVEI